MFAEVAQPAARWLETSGVPVEGALMLACVPLWSALMVLCDLSLRMAARCTSPASPWWGWLHSSKPWPTNLRSLASQDLFNLIHAVWVFFACWDDFQRNEYQFHLFAPNTANQIVFLQVSMAYFTSDTLVDLSRLPPYDVEMFMHHLLAIAGVGLGLYLGNGLATLVMFLLFAEITNPIRIVSALSRRLSKAGFEKWTAVRRHSTTIFKLAYLVFRCGPMLYYPLLFIVDTVNGTHTAQTGASVTQLLTCNGVMLGFVVINLLWAKRIVMGFLAPASYPHKDD
eukprot:m.41839 g.41839  ORF g.41839 m.41839 type:complete len:283 (-) comp14277_c0_seq1:83-931(-)